MFTMKAHTITASSLLSALLLFMTAACTGHDAADRVLNTTDSLSNVQPGPPPARLSQRLQNADHRP